MNPKVAMQRAVVTAPLLTWLIVHGNLCLALRHPQNQGTSRQYAIDFVKGLGRMLVVRGLITEEELKEAQSLEIEEGGADLR